MFLMHDDLKLISLQESFELWSSKRDSLLGGLAGTRSLYFFDFCIVCGSLFRPFLCCPFLTLLFSCCLWSTIDDELASDDAMANNTTRPSIFPPPSSLIQQLKHVIPNHELLKNAVDITVSQTAIPHTDPNSYRHKKSWRIDKQRPRLRRSSSRNQSPRQCKSQCWIYNRKTEGKKVVPW